MDFKTYGTIILQPNDDNVVFKFVITNCSSETVNDGFLPVGSVIISYSVAGYTSTGEETLNLITDSSREDNTILISMKYPGEGKYQIKFLLQLESGMVRELYFSRVVCISGL